MRRRILKLDFSISDSESSSFSSYVFRPKSSLLLFSLFHFILLLWVYKVRKWLYIQANKISHKVPLLIDHLKIWFTPFFYFFSLYSMFLPFLTFMYAWTSLLSETKYTLNRAYWNNSRFLNVLSLHHHSLYFKKIYEWTKRLSVKKVHSQFLSFP